MVPTWTGKPGKWKYIFHSGSFEQTGKFRNFTQNTGKLEEFYPKYWKNEGILGNFISNFVIEVYLLNRFLHLLNLLNKIVENGKQNAGKVGENCHSENVGTMCRTMSSQQICTILAVYEVSVSLKCAIINAFCIVAGVGSNIQENLRTCDGGCVCPW